MTHTKQNPKTRNGEPLAITDTEARRVADSVMGGADMTMSWRDAGYDSAMDAARALVGDHGDEDLEDRAAAIVAREIASIPHGEDLIRDLRREAMRAGDEDQVAICDRALAGDADAIAECERVIDDA